MGLLPFKPDKIPDGMGGDASITFFIPAAMNRGPTWCDGGVGTVMALAPSIRHPPVPL